ncbi:MAG: hypothetical protein NTY04_04025, partial [Candidatus Staskawiczbacteria bacterium]|nr:hypothetical protein [Candidatus Staskawiczbacteria bacterium]
MKIAPILFILFFLVIPVYGFADCSKNGTTVVYINGIFGDINSAKADKNNLEKQYKAKVKNQDVDFINGYNESHAWGIDDVISSAIQMYAKSAEDHDFVDILNQVHGDLKTQKILLLGYSQGSFYSNAIYDYLVKNGVDKNSIAVYNVATPADRVAGPEGHPGKYLTSSTDRVVGGVVSGLAKVGAGKPLPANITLAIQKDE